MYVKKIQARDLVGAVAFFFLFSKQGRSQFGVGGPCFFFTPFFFVFFSGGSEFSHEGNMMRSESDHESFSFMMSDHSANHPKALIYGYILQY